MKNRVCKKGLPFVWLAVVSLCLAFFPHAAYADLDDVPAGTLPKALEGVQIQEHLGQKVNAELSFEDSEGKTFRLKDVFQNGKPTLLTLNYYTCGTLCSVQLNALVKGIQEQTLIPGPDFNLLTISIDPKSMSMMARDKRRAYLELLGWKGADWTFATGTEAHIQELAESVGFRYTYEAETQQYAHIAAAYFLTADGVISRYMYGVVYPGRDIKFALMDASGNRIGNVVDRVLLSCYHYDGSTGRYTPQVMAVMRWSCGTVALILAMVLIVFWRREKTAQA